MCGYEIIQRWGSDIKKKKDIKMGRIQNMTLLSFILLHCYMLKKM